MLFVLIMNYFINVHCNEKWVKKKLKIFTFTLQFWDYWLLYYYNVGYNLANTSGGNGEARKDGPKQI